jgi:probable phosphoglycerate mutase
MLTRVYLVRHGRTDWNAQARIQGHHQTSLNDAGRRQARRVAAYLKSRGIEFLYSSDLDRARQTAEAIAEATGLSIETTPALRERDFGPLTGLLIAEARRKRDGAAAAAGGTDPRLPAEWSVVDTWGAIEGVEGEAKMSERVWGFLRPMAERHAGRTVLVVTHGGVLRTVMYGVLGIEPGKPWRCTLENTAVNLFEVDGGLWRLRMFGYEPE